MLYLRALRTRYPAAEPVTYTGFAPAVVASIRPLGSLGNVVARFDWLAFLEEVSYVQHVEHANDFGGLVIWQAREGTWVLPGGTLALVLPDAPRTPTSGIRSIRSVVSHVEAAETRSEALVEPGVICNQLPLAGESVRKTWHIDRAVLETIKARGHTAKWVEGVLLERLEREG